MKIEEIITYLQQLAPLAYQETYDNAGLLCGNTDWQCTGVICTLDATEQVVLEAIRKGCNLIVAHHPIIFSGLKKITGKTYVERTVIAAIKNDIGIYAIHTNLDNIINGVNGQIAVRLGLIDRQVLVQKKHELNKLVVFVPDANAQKVRDAIFKAGGGTLGNYSECSFNVRGVGTFKPNDGANPYIGEPGERHEENETRIEIVFPSHLQSEIIRLMKEAHPYEEVAYDILPLDNSEKSVGSGLVGNLPNALTENEMLSTLKAKFHLSVIRHTPLTGKPVKRVAVCGGAGSFLTKHAIAAGADFYITGDVKYHEFFDAEEKIVLADIGHFESEQFTISLLNDVLAAKFPTFAVQKSEVKTNPVHYFI